MRVYFSILLMFTPFVCIATSYDDLLKQYQQQSVAPSNKLLKELSFHQSYVTQVCVEAFSEDLANEVVTESFGLIIELDSSGKVINCFSDKHVKFAECISGDFKGRTFRSELNGVRYIHVPSLFSNP